MNRLRIAAAPFVVRPVDDFDAYAGQLRATIAAAADYGARLIVLPEYLSLSLLCLHDVRAPMDEQIRRLAGHTLRVVDVLATAAKLHRVMLAGATMPVLDPGDGDRVFNRAWLVEPSGGVQVQDKVHMTRFEREQWRVTGCDQLKVFDTELGRLAITTCYDVEFPELVRPAARLGVTLLLVPSCTDDRSGFWRVRYCAQARAIENQLYVVHSPLLGGLPMVPAVAVNVGRASILTPCDFGFARDGVLAEGEMNHDAPVIGDMDMELLEHSRRDGTVLPLADSTGHTRPPMVSAGATHE